MAISASVARLPPGGRHGMRLVISTDERSSPIEASIRSSNCPAGPTMGVPDRSSSGPGRIIDDDQARIGIA